MRAIATSLLLAGLASVGTTTQAQVVSQITPQDQNAYNELYREPVATVLRSRSTTDDHDLAIEMMRLASDIPDDPGVQVLIYIQVISFAASSNDLELMLDAAGRLEALWPGRREASPEALLEHAEQSYRLASRTDRPAIAEPYLRLLLGEVARAAEFEDYQQALTYCRQANTIARAVESPRRPEIEQTLEQLSDAYAVVNRIEMLTLSVQRNPQNRPAAVELVDLLVVKRDDPDTAARFAELTQDPETIELLTICRRGVDQAEPPEAMRVGDWYLGMAEDEDDYTAEPLLRRARAWYARFLTEYSRRDTLANRVRSMDQAAEGRLARIMEARQEAEDTGWTDLIAEHFDPEVHWLGRDGIELNFDEAQGELSFARGNVMIPVTPQGDYELRVRVTVNDVEENRAAMIVYLPIGPSRAGTVRFHPNGRRAAVIEGAEVDRVEREAVNRVGVETEILIQVAVINLEQVAIAVLIDEEVVAAWQGNPATLTTDEDLRPPEEMGRIFRFTCPANVTLHRIELREHNE